MNGLIGPMLVQAALMIVITFWLAWARVGSIVRGKVDAKEFERTGIWPHAWIRNAGDNYSNQYEAPILFFVLCFILMQLGAVTQLAVLGAWGFVGSRIVHALVHLTKNVIPLRFFAFLIGIIMLCLLLGIAVGAAAALA
jgi:hypothetical protein